LWPLQSRGDCARAGTAAAPARDVRSVRLLRDVVVLSDDIAAQKSIQQCGAGLWERTVAQFLPELRQQA